MQPLVSVILITSKGIHQDCLKSLFLQTYVNYEILIVSDNPELKHLEDRQTKIPTDIIYNKGRVGVGRARNIGVKESKGEIVVFTDDDAVPELDWIEKLVNCFNEYTDAVFGRVITRTPDLPKSIRRLTELHSKWVGCNMGFRKNVLVKIGLFNEKIHYGGEDNDIIARLIEHGCKIKLCENVVVQHDFAKNYLNLFWKIYKGGENTCLIRGIKDTRFKINRTKIMKALLSQKDYETIIVLLLLFLIRRIGMFIGMIKYAILQ